MKITDSEIIKNSEKELIDAITGELDWSAIEKLLREKHNIGLQDDVEFRNGDLTVFNSQIAYKLDFDVKITLSVIFDRRGNCLRLSAAGEEEEDNSPEPAKETSQAASAEPFHESDTQPEEIREDIVEDIRTEDEDMMAKHEKPDDEIHDIDSEIPPDIISDISSDLGEDTGTDDNVKTVAAEIAGMISEINNS